MTTKTQRLRIYLSKALQVAEELCADEELHQLAESRRDSRILLNLHHFAWSGYQLTGKPIHYSKLMEFLSLQGPAAKAQKILDLACELGWFVRQPDSQLFVPQPRGIQDPAAPQDDVDE